MGIDELKLLVDMFNELGTGAKEVFMWWLLADKVWPTFVWLITFSGIMWIIKQGILALVSQSNSDRAAKNIRSMLHIGCGGYVSESEADEIIYKVKQLYDDEKNRKAALKERLYLQKFDR